MRGKLSETRLTLSRTYYVTATAALFVLLASITCAFVGIKNGAFTTTLLFLLPVIWFLWIGCTFFDATRSIWRLLFLWGLIDVAALALLNLIILNAQIANGPGGEDVAFVIAFSPLNWLVILLAEYFPIRIFEVHPYILTDLGFRTVITDWINMSILVSMPSLCALAIGRFLQHKFSKAA